MSSPVSPAVDAADAGARPPGPGAGPQRGPGSRLTSAFIVANLVGQILIVATGGAVRLTASGLGCSTWPQCEPGSFTPEFRDALTIHPYVEFGNRLVAVVLALVAVVVALRVGRDRSRARSLRLLAFVPLLGVLAQAVIGGLSVLASLHPAVVGSHMLVSLALVSASTVLLHRYREGDGPARAVVGPRVLNLARGLALVSVPVLVLGVITTGSGPHSGDEAVGYRFALDPNAMARQHSLTVWVFVALLVALLVATRRGPVRLRRRLVLLAVATGAQGLIGYVQLFTGLPEVLVGVHVLGAAVLAAATTYAYLGLRERG